MVENKWEAYLSLIGFLNKIGLNTEKVDRMCYNEFVAYKAAVLRAKTSFKN